VGSAQFSKKYTRAFLLPKNDNEYIRNFNITYLTSNEDESSCNSDDVKIIVSSSGLSLEPDQPNDINVFSNYGPNNSFCTNCNLWNTGKHPIEQPYRRAMSFSVAPGTDIKLNSIRLSAYQSSDSADATFLVSVNADANGLPGAELEKFTFNMSGSSHTKPYLLTGESVVHPTLRAGKRYWLTTQVSEPTTMHVNWLMNNLDARGLVASTAGSAPWRNPWGSPQVQGVFNIKGEPTDDALTPVFAVEMSESGMLAANATYNSSSGSYSFMDRAVTGINKPAIKFSNGVITVPLPVDIGQEVTVDFHYKHDLGKSNYQRIMGFVKTDVIRAFSFDSGPADQTGQYYPFGWAVGSFYNSNNCCSVPLANQSNLNWTRATWVISNSTGKTRLYINKVLLIETSSPPNTLDMSAFLSGHIYVGKGYPSANSAASFYGEISDLKIYNQALSLQQIDKLD
jgi:hypothetical protein